MWFNVKDFAFLWVFSRLTCIFSHNIWAKGKDENWMQKYIHLSIFPQVNVNLTVTKWYYKLSCCVSYFSVIPLKMKTFTLFVIIFCQIWTEYILRAVICLINLFSNMFDQFFSGDWFCIIFVFYKKCYFYKIYSFLRKTVPF